MMRLCRLYHKILVTCVWPFVNFQRSRHRTSKDGKSKAIEKKVEHAEANRLETVCQRQRNVWFFLVCHSFVSSLARKPMRRRKRKSTNTRSEKLLKCIFLSLPFLSFLFFLTTSPKESSALFFSHNTQLGPPYRVIIDTNFINFSIQHKLDMVQAMMDCLYAKCIPDWTQWVASHTKLLDCVL